MAGANSGMAPFTWDDPFRLDDQLTEDERMIREAAHGFAQDTLQPRVTDAYRDEIDAPELFPLFGQAGLLGATVPEEYGGAGASYVSYGLIAREIERVDSGYRSMASVQSSLVMFPIHAFGSEEQRRKYLPGLASGELIGCFGLTEPDAGSDPGGMRTYAKKDGDGYVLSGAKTWISNSPSPTSSSSGPRVRRMATAFAASSSKREWKGFPRPRSRASSACVPAPPA